MDTEWLSTPAALRIEARDYIIMSTVFVVMCLFFSLSCIRSRISWLVPTTASLMNCIIRFFMTPPRPTDHGYSANLIWCFVVTLSAFGLWLLRYNRERTDWPHNSNARTGEMAKEISISQIPIFPLNLSGLVLFCIDTSDSESRRIFQHFSRSTRLPFLCTAPVLIFALFCKFSLNFPIFC